MLLATARAGDESAYRQLIEPHRRELHAHCHRMLGSLHDSEDAPQDALLRAWRGLLRCEGRGLRAWLYKIATNSCLDAIAKRQQRVLPLDHGPRPMPRTAVTTRSGSLANGPLSGQWQWRHLPAFTNGQARVSIPTRSRAFRRSRRTR